MNLTETLFTTGEFAKLCDVKKQTLFHYDEVGILKPEHRNEKGYRFYSLKQMELFNVIEMLKSLELSLIEIKDFLASRSIAESVQLLNTKEHEIDLKIKQMEQLKESIKNKRKYLKASSEADFSTIKIVELPPTYYLISEDLSQTNIKSSSQLLMNFIKKHHLDFGYPIGVIIRKEDIKNENNDYLANFYTQIENNRYDPHLVRRAGQYVIAYHEGHDDLLYQTHRKIDAFLQKTGYKIVGDSFEEYAVDEISTDGPDKYVTKISMEVVKY
ncbi:hypothetical protein BU056_07960 [Staphylococcus succinus]|nr:hypothetical protein BU056_07960 [Staphylococcus succinus]